MVLIGGGARSGKSTAALGLLRSYGPRQGFIATAEAFDGEMANRIAKHKAERAPEITTWEEPLAVAELLRSVGDQFNAIVLDCLTLWLTNLILSNEPPFTPAYDALLSAAAEVKAVVILVTNEVGAGIVPDNALARSFRDEQGRLNQLAAARATEVYFMTFGLSTRLK